MSENKQSSPTVRMIIISIIVLPIAAVLSPILFQFGAGPISTERSDQIPADSAFNPYEYEIDQLDSLGDRHLQNKATEIRVGIQDFFVQNSLRTTDKVDIVFLDGFLRYDLKYSGMRPSQPSTGASQVSGLVRQYYFDDSVVNIDLWCYTMPECIPTIDAIKEEIELLILANRDSDLIGDLSIAGAHCDYEPIHSHGISSPYGMSVCVFDDLVVYQSVKLTSEQLESMAQSPESQRLRRGLREQGLE